MTYEKDLAFFLRNRGVAEERVAEVLADVRTQPDQSEAGLIEEFGSPSEYAEQFRVAKRRSLSRGTTITAVGIVVALAYLVAALIVLPLLGSEVLEVAGHGVPRIWPAGVVVTVFMVVGFLVDRSRPLPPVPSQNH